MSDQGLGAMNTVEEEYRFSEQLLRTWLTGADTLPDLQQYPETWQGALQGLGSDKQALSSLIIASQMQSLCGKVKPPETLTRFSDLPDIALPVLDDALRPLFRRVLGSVEKDQRQVGLLLSLLMTRGVSAHPMDWMPEGLDEFYPKLYWGWCQWVVRREQTNQTEQNTLDADNWDEWYPAEKVAMLKQMRRDEPARARALLSECVAGESADKRLRYYQCLSVNLDSADEEILKTLLQDRAKKVNLLAGQLLSRLNITLESSLDENVKEKASELAAFYTMKSAGLLKRKSQLLPEKLKSKKQQAMRTEMLEQVPLPQFAEALHITLGELVQRWMFSANRYQDNMNFVLNACNVLPDALLADLSAQLLNSWSTDDNSLELLKLLLPRLDATDRSQIVSRLLGAKKYAVCFSDAIAFVDAPVEHINRAMLFDAYGWQRAISDVKAALQGNTYVDHYFIQQELLALGMILPAETAQIALDSLTEKGLLQADPVLDCLKLNASLGHSH